MDPEWDIDIAMPVLFVLFLSAFLVVGLFPMFERSYQRLRQYFHTRQKSKCIVSNSNNLSLKCRSVLEEETPSLDYYETAVTKLLADPRYKRLPLGKIVAELGLETEQIEQALKQLVSFGLVCFAQSRILPNLYYLSKKGRDYAIAQALIPFPDRRYRKSRYRAMHPTSI